MKYLNEQKIFIQNLIKESKLMFHKNIEYLNQSNDSNPFWHICNKALGNKRNNPSMVALQGHTFSKMNSYLKNSLTIASELKKRGKSYDNAFKII